MEDQVQKVLRIGVTSGGKIVDEFIVNPRDHVAFGTGTENERIKHDSRKLRGVKLFEFDTERPGYKLNLMPGMSSRIVSGEDVRDISGPMSLNVSVDERGKIVCGEQTVIFQFVESKVAAPRKPSVLDAPVKTTRMTGDRLSLILRMVTVGVQLALDAARFERIHQIANANYRSGDRYANEILGANGGCQRKLEARISRFERRIEQLSENDKHVLEVLMKRTMDELKTLDGRLADPNADPSALQSMVRELERKIIDLTTELATTKISPASIAKQAGDSN